MATDVKITTHQRLGRTCACTGSKWEPKMGYSRAVRAGNWIAVTGTVGINSDGTYSKNLGDQTKRSLDIIKCSLEALGGSMESVIRTRIFTTRISEWESIASVHGEIFGEIRPCTTLVGVKELIDGDALIEIEVDAVVN